MLGQRLDLAGEPGIYRAGVTENIGNNKPTIGGGWCINFQQKVMGIFNRRPSAEGYLRPPPAEDVLWIPALDSGFRRNDRYITDTLPGAAAGVFPNSHATIKESRNILLGPIFLP